MRDDELNIREKGILRHIVLNYIQMAIPVGSRYVSKKFERQLSPATIRNVMSDLEERGFLRHPHTSAGRMPTDLGYRYYVDYLMDIQQVAAEDKSQIDHVLDRTNDADEMLRETSRLLSKISKQLSIVAAPQLSSGVFDRLELFAVSSNKLLVVMSIRTGLVKTVMLEIRAEVRRDTMEQISSLLNERLSGLTIEEIKNTFVERLRDVQDERTGLVRLFIESVDQLFDEGRERDKIHITGTQNIIDQPEFVDPKNFRSVIELIEDEEMIVHLLEKHQLKDSDFIVTIGSEHEDDRVSEYSIVSAPYETAGAMGTIGIIGPKRMDYSKMIPLVEYVAQRIAKLIKGV
jgi:heat-inducible transcriptional repressor